MSDPTPRQLWVLIVYMETGSIDGAAKRLGLTRDTVRNHLAACRTSLRARNTAQAFGIAVQSGLIDHAQMRFELAIT